jgi:prophage regulatory protein
MRKVHHSLDGLGPITGPKGQRMLHAFSLCRSRKPLHHTQRGSLPLQGTKRQGKDAMETSGLQIIREDELTKTLNMHRATIARLEELGDFPRRVKLGRRAVGWLRTDIEKWLAARLAARTETASKQES